MFFPIKTPKCQHFNLLLLICSVLDAYWKKKKKKTLQTDFMSQIFDSKQLFHQMLEPRLTVAAIYSGKDLWIPGAWNVTVTRWYLKSLCQIPQSAMLARDLCSRDRHLGWLQTPRGLLDGTQIPRLSEQRGCWKQTHTSSHTHTHTRSQHLVGPSTNQ